MLAAARARFAGRPGSRVELLQAEAERLPFPDESFDAVSFTYLLRYVDDPPSTMCELARVLRPGGTIGSVEFGVPGFAPARAAWRLYTEIGLPVLGRAFSREWEQVGRFLGPSIRGFYERHPRGAARPLLARGGPRARGGAQDELRRGRGDERPQAPHPGPERLSGGAPGVPPARGRGGAAGLLRARTRARRRLVALLHPPYTLWHLSYFAIGAALAPTVHVSRLLWGLAAFALAVGVAAHALDELHDRPLGTSVSDRFLLWCAILSLAAALAIGVAGILTVSVWLTPLVIAGGLFLPAYNLELAGGRFHSDLWFALGWGAFPAFTGFFVNALRVEAAGLLIAAGCLAISLRSAGCPPRRGSCAGARQRSRAPASARTGPASRCRCRACWTRSTVR